MPIGKAVLDLIEAKAAPSRSKRSLGELHSRLSRFTADHPGQNLAEFTTTGLQCWLDGLT